MRRINVLYRKYEEQVRYLFFGVQTTVVNYAVYAILLHSCGAAYDLLINAVSFVAATSFSYLTNKLFVFKSRSWHGKTVLREIGPFFMARLFSFGIEEVGLYICNHVIHMGNYLILGINGAMVSKIFLSFVAVSINYVFSKLFIFKKRRNDEEKANI